MRYALAMAAVLFAGLVVFSDNAVAAPPGCASAAYAHSGWRVERTFEWWYNPTGATGNALPVVRRALSSAFSGKNECGLPGVRVRQVYRGITNAVPGYGGSSDGVSVVGWVNVGSSDIAKTYVWKRGSRVRSADITINTERRFFFGGPVPAGCSVHFDLEGVLVHEGGHVLGVDHVSDATQVMVGRTPPCSVGKRTYKSGDIRGLRTLYGRR